MGSRPNRLSCTQGRSAANSGVMLHRGDGRRQVPGDALPRFTFEVSPNIPCARTPVHESNGATAEPECIL